MATALALPQPQQAFSPQPQIAARGRDARARSRQLRRGSHAPSAIVAPGAVVAGRYQLEGVIGEGGMGTIWAALHTGLGHRLALKVIAARYHASALARRRFEIEARAVARVRSPHVVQVFDSGAFEDGSPYIAMELLRGESVASRVRRSGPLAVQEALPILVQCCDALEGAHVAGVVHQDIKPENLFLAQYDDGSVLAKVLDFGIAKCGEDAADVGPACVGTPLYMSPEQAARPGAGYAAPLDHRSDLFSLGLVAFTMLTGTTARDPRARANRVVVEARLPSLRARAPWLPPALESWFERACATEPGERFASASELARALCEACEAWKAPAERGRAATPANARAPAAPARCRLRRAIGRWARCAQGPPRC